MCENWRQWLTFAQKQKPGAKEHKTPQNRDMDKI